MLLYYNLSLSCIVCFISKLAKPFSFPIRHFTFIVSTARLYAGIYNIPYSEKVGHVHSHIHSNSHTYSLTDWTLLLSQDLAEEAVTRVLSDIKIPEYRPSEKVSFSLIWSLISIRV